MPNYKIISFWKWFRNVDPPGSNPASGAYMYGEADTIKVRQANGTIFTLGPPVEIDSVIFDGGSPSTDHTLGDSIKFDAGAVT